MIKIEDVYRIGLINKPHGVHGELLFTFDDDIFDRMEADYIICMMDGILVPFFLKVIASEVTLQHSSSWKA